MIVDTLDHLKDYCQVHHLLAEAEAFLTQSDLSQLEVGKVVLKADDLIVNVQQTSPKTRAQAKLETHRDFIDIQIPLSGVEEIGYTPAADCKPADASYNADKDITFFEGEAQTYLSLRPGMFAIFFPQDGHAPGITPDGVKKIVVKVRV